jgi:hypothetical protein
MKISRLVFGIGYSTEGPFVKTINRRRSNLFRKWEGMFSRCYSKVKQSSHPAYIGCTVDPRFHDYQQFCAWAVKQVGHENASWELDKDILKKGNRIYGPDTCAFVPPEINTLFRNRKSDRGDFPIGIHAQDGRYAAMVRFKGNREWVGRYETPELAFLAYKLRKEEIIKTLASEYKGLVSNSVYEAMMAYEVKITD